MEANIVVLKIVVGTGEFGDEAGSKVTSWGRGTMREAEYACTSKPWPAKSSDEFLAVDDWGYGNVVLCPSRPELIGLSRREALAAL